MGGAPLPLLCFCCCCFTLLLQGADAATFTITNSCSYTVWPGILSNAGTPPPSTTGFALAPGQSATVTVTASWSGRIWARTLCATSASTGAFACATADCGSGTVECSGRGAAPPATLAELTLAGGGGDNDFYDVSLVDGFNLPMLVAPRTALPAGNGSGSSCRPTGCAADLNAACPAELRVVAAAPAVACRSACEAFAAEEYCCSGAYGSPATCAPTNYSRFFKALCPLAYSYAYDDATSTFTCASAAAAGGGGYDVVFCPKPSSLKSGGNPEAAGLPPSTMEFSGHAGRLTTTRDTVAPALLQMVVVFSAMSWQWWW